MFLFLLLESSWFDAVDVNLTAVKRRADSLSGRRTVKKQWQVVCNTSLLPHL